MSGIERNDWMKHVIKTSLFLAGAGALIYAGRAVFVEKRSIGSKIVEDLIRIANFDLEEVDSKMLARNFKENRKEHKIRENLMRSKVEYYYDAGMKVYRIIPKDKESIRRVQNLHGGGYIYQPTTYLWQLRDKLDYDTGPAF